MYDVSLVVMRDVQKVLCYMHGVMHHILSHNMNADSLCRSMTAHPKMAWHTTVERDAAVANQIHELSQFHCMVMNIKMRLTSIIMTHTCTYVSLFWLNRFHQRNHSEQHPLPGVLSEPEVRAHRRDVHRQLPVHAGRLPHADWTARWRTSRAASGRARYPINIQYQRRSLSWWRLSPYFNIRRRFLIDTE